MIHRLVLRHLRAVTLSTAALLAGLASAGAAAAVTVGTHGGAAVGPRADSGYILCVAYQQQFGICIGPPTN